MLISNCHDIFIVGSLINAKSITLIAVIKLLSQRPVSLSSKAQTNNYFVFNRIITKDFSCACLI